MTQNNGNDIGSEYEQKCKQFLIEHSIAFKCQKKWRGYGNKLWITDFYLYEHDIVLEVKKLSDLPNQQHTIFKDLYKLDELGLRYALTKVLLINGIPPKMFNQLLPNISAHGTYLITNINQIIPIIQGQTIQQNYDLIEEKILIEKKNQKTHDLKDIPFELKILSEYAEGHSSDTIKKKHPETKDRKAVMRAIRKASKVLFEKYCLDLEEKED